MKKFLALLLSLTTTLGLCSFPAYAAPDWPAGTAIEAEGGIVIDADSGAVIYGKNIHEAYYPASITKILTALIVIERCDLDEMVTFSHNAVYNVEAGSSSAGLDEGDVLTVRNALYAMMLKSANEAANALAEHTAGSVEAFADLMNQKARELGCQNSNFRNPSGLNDSNHYTTAYDMALISKAAFQNETFVEIDSTLYYDIPPTKRNTEGIRVYPGHRMLKKSESVYYEGIIGGKTGYTSLAGNTLVTCAARNNMKLITVILNGHSTHYSDTKTLLDFGFNNFKSVRVSDYETAYTDVESELTFAGLPTADLSVLSFTKGSTITLPKNADFSDAESSISYELGSADPEKAAAKIQYTYHERKIGTAYLMRSEELSAASQSEAAFIDPVVLAAPDSSTGGSDEENMTSSEETTAAPAPIDTTPFEIPPIFFTVILSILIAGAMITVLVVWRLHVNRREKEEQQLRYEKRQQRLKEMGISNSEFEQMLNKKRSIVSRQGSSDDE